MGTGNVDRSTSPRRSQLTALHRRIDRFVFGAHPVGVGDHDDAAPGDRAGEGDGAGRRRGHVRTAGARQIDAAVPGGVRRRRWRETAEQRPARRAGAANTARRSRRLRPRAWRDRSLPPGRPVPRRRCRHRSAPSRQSGESGLSAAARVMWSRVMRCSIRGARPDYQHDNRSVDGRYLAALRPQARPAGPANKELFRCRPAP